MILLGGGTAQNMKTWADVRALEADMVELAARAGETVPRSVRDLVEHLSERYRRFEQHPEAAKNSWGPGADLLRRLPPGDVLLQNLSNEPEHLSLLAALTFARGGSYPTLRAGLIAYNRLNLLRWSAVPPFQGGFISLDAVAVLATQDEPCFAAYVEGVTDFLPVEPWQSWTPTFSNIVASLINGIDRPRAVECANEVLASERPSPLPSFDASVVAFLRALLLGDGASAAEAFARVAALHRRSKWLATRMPVNRYVPVFALGLYFLARRSLPETAFATADLLTYLPGWAQFARSVEAAAGDPIEPFVDYTGEVAFLAELTRNPMSSRELRARLREQFWEPLLKARSECHGSG